MRITLGVLPYFEHTPGLPLLARDARLAQAQFLTMHYPAAAEGDR